MNWETEISWQKERDPTVMDQGLDAIYLPSPLSPKEAAIAEGVNSN